MKKYLISIIFILVIFLLQYNILNFLGKFLVYINPMLFFVILVSLFFPVKITIFWVMAAGFLLDLYSLLNFGVHLTSFMLMVLLLNYFFQKFITNHTLYSFIFLTAASTLFYYLLLISSTYLLSAFNFSELSWAINNQISIAILIQIIVNSAAMGLVYIVFSYFSNRLKANFILKGKY
jgi:cell shape-determining protein MreD